MKEKLIEKAMLLRQESEEAERQISFVRQQVAELESFEKSLSELERSKEKEMILPIGSGVFMKAERNSREKIFVDIGAGIIIKKSISETREVILEQIKKFRHAEMILSERLESFSFEFMNMLEEVKKIKANQ